MHLVGFNSNSCNTMHGTNKVKLQYGVWNCEAANLNQFIAYTGRTQRHTHARTHARIKNPERDYCRSTAKGERHPTLHELQQHLLTRQDRHCFFSEKYSRCVHLILIYYGTKAASFLFN